MGRPSIGIVQPAAPLVATLVRQARLMDFSSDQIAALTYGRGMDTTRFSTVAGFAPAYSSRAALEEFAASAAPGALSTERVEAALASVASILGRAGERG